MKLLFLLFLFFSISACDNKKLVYWCGDHPCVNNKERIAYFQKTMTVEMRESSKGNKIDLKEEKRLKRKAKLELKKQQQNEKRLKKQAKLEEKIRAQNKKKKKKIFKNTKKINKDKKVSKEIIQDDKVIEESNKVAKRFEINKSDNFDEILDVILNSEKNKKFPDINSFPE